MASDVVVSNDFDDDFDTDDENSLKRSSKIKLQGRVFCLSLTVLQEVRTSSALSTYFLIHPSDTVIHLP
jgi:hypothetical protein